MRAGLEFHLSEGKAIFISAKGTSTGNGKLLQGHQGGGQSHFHFSKGQSNLLSTEKYCLTEKGNQSNLHKVYIVLFLLYKKKKNLRFFFSAEQLHEIGLRAVPSM